MKRVQLALLAWIALCGPAQGEGFSDFIVFGDSLSDAGTYIPVVPPGGGRFTTNPGPVWSENVSRALGSNPAPAQFYNGTGFVPNAGGNIWAEGGARVNAAPGYGLAVAQPVATQIDAYLARGGRPSGNALYAFWAGANDIFFQADSGSPAPVVAVNVAIAAQDLATQIARLQAAGARYIMVINLPDIGQTPGALAAGPAASSALTSLSQLYNASLDAALAGTGVRAIRLDSYRLFNEVLANPAAYGFVVGNTAVACLPPGSSSLLCTPANLATPTAASTFMFADSVHPTTAMHRIVSDYILSVLWAPAVVAGTAERLGGAGDVQWQGSDSRLRRFLDGLQAEEASDFYVSGQAVDARLDADNDTSGLKGHPYSLRLGVDRNFGDGWFAGLAISYVADRFDFSDGGSARGRGFAVNAYGSKRLGPLYLSAAAAWTHVDYDIKRDFALGVTTREEEGSTSGNAKGLRLEAGFDLAQGIFRHGPLAALTYGHVRLAGYSEDSGRSTAMRFGDQTFEQLRSSLGYQASWQASDSLRLSGRLTWEHERKDSRRDLAIGLVTNSGEMTMPVGREGGSYALLNLGGDWSVGKASALAASLNATSSQSGARQAAALLTYSFRF